MSFSGNLYNEPNLFVLKFLSFLIVLLYEKKKAVTVLPHLKFKKFTNLTKFFSVVVMLVFLIPIANKLILIILKISELVNFR